jgi:hypothetical protein
LAAGTKHYSSRYILQFDSSTVFDDLLRNLISTPYNYTSFATAHVFDSGVTSTTSMGILTSSQSPGGSNRGGGATTLLLTATVTSLLLLNYVASSTSARVNVKCMTAGPCTEHLSNNNNVNPGPGGNSSSSSKYTQEHMREMYTELFKQKILDALRLPSAGGNGSASSSHRHGDGDGGSHGYRSSSSRSSVLVNRTVVIPASLDAQPDPRHPLYTNYNPTQPLAGGGVVGGASDRASVASLPLSERLIQNLTAFAWTQWHRPSKESVSLSQGESRGQGHDRTTRPTSSAERRSHANNNSSRVNVVSPPRKSQLVIPLNSKPGKKRQSGPSERPGQFYLTPFRF